MFLIQLYGLRVNLVGFIINYWNNNKKFVLASKLIYSGDTNLHNQIKKKGQIYNTNITNKTHTDIHIQCKINPFFHQFRIATLMHRCVIPKCYCHSVRSLIGIIFCCLLSGRISSEALLSTKMPRSTKIRNAIYSRAPLTLVGGVFWWRDRSHYGKRRDIETFSKMANQHLKMTKAI